MKSDDERNDGYSMLDEFAAKPIGLNKLAAMVEEREKPPFVKFTNIYFETINPPMDLGSSSLSHAVCRLRDRTGERAAGIVCGLYQANYVGRTLAATELVDGQLHICVLNHLDKDVWFVYNAKGIVFSEGA